MLCHYYCVSHIILSVFTKDPYSWVSFNLVIIFPPILDHSCTVIQNWSSSEGGGLSGIFRKYKDIITGIH